MNFRDKLKAKIDEAQEARAASTAMKSAAKQAAAAAAREAAVVAAARRAQMRAVIAKSCPLPLLEGEPSLPGGLELFADEFVVTQGRDWGLSSDRMVLTTQRIIKTEGRCRR